MPYDPAVTRKLLSIAGAYANNPLGELSSQMAAQLTLAESEIRAASEATAAANLAREKADAALASAEHTIARLRAGSTGMPGLIDALKSIALNPKGAAKVAKAALDSIGA